MDWCSELQKENEERKIYLLRELVGRKASKLILKLKSACISYCIYCKFYPLQRKSLAKEKLLQSVVADKLSFCVDFPHVNK